MEGMQVTDALNVRAGTWALTLNVHVRVCLGLNCGGLLMSEEIETVLVLKMESKEF
jgi:hypothetical protein